MGGTGGPQWAGRAAVWAGWGVEEAPEPGGGCEWGEGRGVAGFHQDTGPRPSLSLPHLLLLHVPLGNLQGQPANYLHSNVTPK